MTEGGLTGGQLARLDEVADVTREYGRVARLGLGIWTSVVVGAWCLGAEVVSASSVVVGALVYALGVVVATVVLLAEVRRQRVTWAPADAFERKVVAPRWRAVVLMALGVLSGGNLLWLASLEHAGDPAVLGCWFLVAALVVVLLASPFLLARAGEAAVGAAVPVQLGAFSLAVRRQGWSGWTTPALAGGLIVLALGLGWYRRRQCKRLEVRLTFLQEHAR